MSLAIYYLPQEYGGVRLVRLGSYVPWRISFPVIEHDDSIGEFVLNLHPSPADCLLYLPQEVQHKWLM